jgi:hypothetical protein
MATPWTRDEYDAQQAKRALEAENARLRAKDERVDLANFAVFMIIEGLLIGGIIVEFLR